MGEVFRARDVRLKRDVALKVLLAAGAGDAGRLSRFEREAQVLAALNHPNIAQVFGIETCDGAPVIAMELVEGQTLADRLSSGPLPAAEALAIAAQLCDGLEAAHERGIIHRDLKPANISLRSDGQVKILDFGLARDAAADAGDASMQTATGARTEEGVVMGTAPYMSPEQARGLPVDRRTDIWAFGCVLYEMLAGARAFAGATATDTLIAVVQQAPEWSRLPPTLSPRIVELLGRCLAKNPKERQRDIADARFEIERARSGDSQPLTASAALPQPNSRRTPILTFIAGAAIATSIFALLPRSEPVAPRPVVRLTVTLPPDTTLALSRGSAVTVSPDGSRVVFATRSKTGVKLYVRSLDHLDIRELPGTEDATSPFFSRDGKWIGFFIANKLLKVPVDGGGSPITLAAVSNARGHAWGADDSILITPANNQPLFRLPAAGGTPSAVTTLREGELSHRWPTILPGGSLLFSIWNDTGWESARVVAERAGSGERVAIAAGGGYPRYVRDGASSGFLVYARDSGLLAAPFDESRLAVTGQAVPVLEGLNTNLSGGAHFDISPSGTLAYVPGSLSEGRRELRWVYPEGNSETALTTDMGRFFSLSFDDRRIARINTAGPTRDVFVDDLTRKTSTVLTRQDGNFIVVWSRDGDWVYLSRGVPRPNLYRRAADGSDREDRLTSSPNAQVPSSVSPDGKLLAYVESDPVNSSDIWVLPLPEAMPAGNESGRGPAATPRPFLRTKSSETSPAFSPDGKWMAYQSNETGRFEVYVRSFPDAANRIQVSTAGGTWPVWAPSGSALYFRSMNGQQMASAVRGSDPLQFDAPSELFNASGYENHFGISADGKRFLMMPLIPAESAPSQLRIVLNFLEELRQRIR
jgi:eukaryotic-like serine/threonine-protein kinase